MKIRIFTVLLALSLLLALFPTTVLAAPTPAESVSLNAEYRYTLTGLPYGLIVQNFFIDGDTLYLTQHGGSGITYLSRLEIQGDKAVYRDHMTLNNCGRGESLAGYYYNNKLYFYIGCKIDTSATTNYSTQVARVPYEAGKTYTYTQLNRFDHLNYVTTDGSRVGTLYRNNVCANSQYTIFRVQTTEGTVTYACYDTKGLNELLDASQSVDLSKEAPRKKIIYSLTQSGADQIVRPNGSFQGVELYDKNTIFTCGGAGEGVVPMIGKLNSSGKFLCQATIANVGTSSINGLQVLNGKIYFAVEGNSRTDGQMIYSIDLMNMGTLSPITNSTGVATLHQLPCVNPDTDKNDYQQNMSYVIRTGKGKTIVIDGGWSEYDGAYMFSYLQKVTGETNPHIDAWFLTHPHGDHYGVLLEFANKYASQVTVDTFYHRMPTAEETDKYFYNANPTKIKNALANILNKVGLLKDRQGNPTRIVSVNPVHSGKCNSSFDFDDVHFDILMTVDDLFWGCDNITTKFSGTKANAGHVYTNETIAQLTADNLNNSSVVFRVTMGSKTILFLGDAAQSAGIMLKRYHDANKADSTQYFSLKSDIVQIAHHGTNNVQQVVYEAIDPDIALWPTPKWDYAATADYSITQYYTRQWTKAIGTVDYVSGYGPQVLYFPTDVNNIPATDPDKGHSYSSYTDLGDGTHSAYCVYCSTNIIKDHAFVDGICVCGAVEYIEPTEPTEDSALKLGHTLNLASDISVNFVVAVEAMEGYDMDTVYAECRYYDYVGNEEGEERAIILEPELKGSYYYFTLEGLNATQMTTELTTVLYGTKGGQPYYSPTDIYSIATYAYSQMSKDSVPNSLKVLCADLLRYGSATQVYKGYRTDDLADRNMTEEQKLYLTDTENLTFGSVNQVGTELDAPLITWEGKSLDLQSKVGIKFVANLTNYTGNKEDLTLKVTYVDCTGTQRTEILEDMELYKENRCLYAFSYYGLLAAELRTPLTVQIMERDTPVSCTLTYSADTYGNNKTDQLLTVCKALFAYSDSAKSYFAG